MAKSIGNKRPPLLDPSEVENGYAKFSFRELEPRIAFDGALWAAAVDALDDSSPLSSDQDTSPHSETTDLTEITRQTQPTQEDINAGTQGSGGNSITDSDAGAVEGIAITCLTGPNGKSETQPPILKPDDEDMVHRAMDQSFSDLDRHNQLFDASRVDLSLSVGSVLSAGFVTWVLCSGALMSTMPDWRGFDPVLILGTTSPVAIAKLPKDEQEDAELSNAERVLDDAVKAEKEQDRS